MTWYNKIIFKTAQVSEKDIDTSKLSPKNKNGDCFKVAANYVVDNSIFGASKDLLLVHGEVTGQGSIAGIRYQHAWVEKGDEVIDRSNNRDIHMPKAFYYAIGNIRNTKTYTPEETRKMLLKHKTYGPWQ